MAYDLMSKKTRNEYREYFVGTTLRTIEMEFDAADVSCDLEYDPQIGGARRTLVEQYYCTVDWTKWADVRKIINVYENVLDHLEELAKDSNDYAQKDFDSLRKWLKKDGFEYKDGKLKSIGDNRALEDVADTTLELDMPELNRQIDRMKSAVNDDPSLAIGTAKELVETTCKTILDQRSVKIENDADIGKLVKETRKCLGLDSEAIPESVKGAKVIHRLLSSLGGITQGLAELRNLYGTGHGKHGSSGGISSRHAKLAVGSAAALVVFLFETHNEKEIKN